MFQIRIFSESAISKLQNLKNDLESLQKKDLQKGRSDYSKQMVEKTIKAIDLVLQNNSINYWKEDKNQDALQEHIDFLDNFKGTFVPEVFNEESKELAEILLNYVKNFNQEKDLEGTANLALKSIVDPKNLITTMQNNLQFKIGFYETLVKNSGDVKLSSQLYDNLFKKLNEYIERAKTLTPNTYGAFKKDYEAFFAEMMQEANKLLYVRILNADQLVNAKEPYNLSSQEIHSSGNRGTLIWKLINAELQINSTLLANTDIKAANLAMMSLVYTTYSQSFDVAKCQQTEEEFANIQKEFSKAAEEYKKGDHLKGQALVKKFSFGFAQRHVDKQKIECIDKTITVINTLVKQNSDPKSATGVRCFDAFKSTLDAAKANEKIAKEKNISLGEFSKLVNAFGLKFFALSYFGIDQTNDKGISQILQIYEEGCGIKPIIPNQKTVAFV